MVYDNGMLITDNLVVCFFGELLLGGLTYVRARRIGCLVAFILSENP